MQDDNFLEEANKEALNSSCLSRCVGAIILVEKKIVARGFNETDKLSKCGDGGCERCQLRARGIIKTGEKREQCVCVHAEINAIRNLEDDRYINKKMEMFVTIPPCEECGKAIVRAGISRVFYPKPKHSGKGIMYLWQMGIEAEGM